MRHRFRLAAAGARAAWALVLALPVFMMPVAALAQADSVKQRADTMRPEMFKKRDLWLVGGFALGTVAVRPFDESMAQRLQLQSNQNRLSLRNAATIFRSAPTAAEVVVCGGLFVVGRFSHNQMLTDLGLHSAEAVVAAGVVGWAVKGVAGRARPYVNPLKPGDFKFGRGFLNHNDYQSFPSGHTLAAFTLASEMTWETQHRWPSHTVLVGALTYTAASLTGISRMYNNDHWASDVVFGAGLGTLVGTLVARYAYSHPTNWADRVLGHVSIRAW